MLFVLAVDAVCDGVFPLDGGAADPHPCVQQLVIGAAAHAWHIARAVTVREQVLGGHVAKDGETVADTEEQHEEHVDIYHVEEE